MAMFGHEDVRAVTLCLVTLLMCIKAAPGSGAETGTHTAITVMPFGDSITTCCHACAVPAELLPADVRHRAEPSRAANGYMRPLWHMLRSSNGSAHGHSAHDQPPQFRFVGRMRDCIFRKRDGPVAETRDWPVRYEGYFGHTTKHLLRKNIGPDAVAAAIADTGAPPDITLVHVGTNDLLLGKGRYAGGKIVQLLLGLMLGTSDRLPPLLAADTSTRRRYPVNATERETLCRCLALRRSGPLRRRAIVLSIPLPVDFGLVSIGAADINAYNTRAERNPRHQGLRGAVRDAFDALTAGSSTTPAAMSARSPSYVTAPRAVKLRPDGIADLRDRCRCGAADDRCWDAATAPAATKTRNASAAHLDASSDVATDLVLVDMHTDVDPATALRGDGVHPTALGERIMAERYAAAIFAVLAHWGTAIGTGAPALQARQSAQPRRLSSERSRGVVTPETATDAASSIGDASADVNDAAPSPATLAVAAAFSLSLWYICRRRR
jgi:lysophospholipase L1-like esterase